MSLQTKIDNSPPNDGQKQDIQDKIRVLNNQLSHLLSVYDFVVEYQELGIQPDELHRVLFQKTSLTPQGFKMRMTKASRASEVLGTMLQANNYYADMREDLESMDFSRESILDATQFLNKEEYDHRDGLQQIISDSIEEIRINDSDQEMYEVYSNLDSETFDEVAAHFSKMSDWYESVLLEEGLIPEGERRTPSFGVLVALCIVYLCGAVMIANGFVEEDSSEMLNGMALLAMGYLTFVGL